MEGNGVTPQPPANLVARTVDLMLGWWDAASHTQVPGLPERVNNISMRLETLETDKVNLKKLGTKALWVVIALMTIPFLHSLGVPTDTLWKLVPGIGGH